MQKPNRTMLGCIADNGEKTVQLELGPFQIRS